MIRATVEVSEMRRTRALGLAFLLAVALVSPVATAGGAEEPAPREAFVVDLQEDGSATVTLRLTFDLRTDGERTAFRELRDNETTRRQFRDAFGERLGHVATSAAEETGREMAVTDAAASVESTGDTGVVELSATWTGLAVRDDDRLVLAAPFDSGFDAERRIVVRAPDGYALSTTQPEPESAGSGTAVWSSSSSLDGFRVVAAPAAATASVTTDGSGAGFTSPAALSALLAVALLAARLRD